MIARALIFMAVFAALQLSWQWSEERSWHHWLIDQGVVAPTAAVGRTLLPGVGITASGNRLRGAGGGLNIVNGCDGFETLFLLIAGFAVAPLSARSRFRGVLAGLPVVYVLNVARILALYYAQASDGALFDLLHGIVTPVLMVVAIAGFYYVWLRRAEPPAAA